MDSAHLARINLRLIRGMKKNHNNLIEYADNLKNHHHYHQIAHSYFYVRSPLSFSALTFLPAGDDLEVYQPRREAVGHRKGVVLKILDEQIGDRVRAVDEVEHF